MIQSIDQHRRVLVVKACSCGSEAGCTLSAQGGRTFQYNQPTIDDILCYVIVRCLHCKKLLEFTYDYEASE